MFGASTDSSGAFSIEGISVGKYSLVCDYIGYRSGLKIVYISSFDSDGDEDEEQSYLDKVGIDEDEYDDKSSILKGNSLWMSRGNNNISYILHASDIHNKTFKSKPKTRVWCCALTS